MKIDSPRVFCLGTPMNCCLHFRYLSWVKFSISPAHGAMLSTGEFHDRSLGEVNGITLTGVP